MVMFVEIDSCVKRYAVVRPATPALDDLELISELLFGARWNFSHPTTTTSVGIALAYSVDRVQGQQLIDFLYSLPSWPSRRL